MNKKYSIKLLKLFIAVQVFVISVAGCKSNNKYTFEIDKAPVVIKFTIPKNSFHNSYPTNIQHNAIIQKITRHFSGVDRISLIHFFKIDRSLFYGEYSGYIREERYTFFVCSNPGEMNVYAVQGLLNKETRVSEFLNGIKVYKKTNGITLEIHFDLRKGIAYLTRDDGFTVW